MTTNDLRWALLRASTRFGTVVSSVNDAPLHDGQHRQVVAELLLEHTDDPDLWSRLARDRTVGVREIVAARRGLGDTNANTMIEIGHPRVLHVIARNRWLDVGTLERVRQLGDYSYDLAANPTWVAAHPAKIDGTGDLAQLQRALLDTVRPDDPALWQLNVSAIMSAFCQNPSTDADVLCALFDRIVELGEDAPASSGGSLIQLTGRAEIGAHRAATILDRDQLALVSTALRAHQFDQYQLAALYDTHTLSGSTRDLPGWLHSTMLTYQRLSRAEFETTIRRGRTDWSDLVAVAQNQHIPPDLLRDTIEHLCAARSADFLKFAMKNPVLDDEALIGYSHSENRVVADTAIEALQQRGHWAGLRHLRRDHQLVSCPVQLPECDDATFQIALELFMDGNTLGEAFEIAGLVLTSQ